MSFSLNEIFTTATAFNASGSTYKEVLPCNELKPYIRCFWEADRSDIQYRIIPDCCADILFYSSNGKACCDFCGVSNRSFISQTYNKVFGIRFYAWTVNLFSSMDMSDTLNGYFSADSFFDRIQLLAERIIASESLHERIDEAQKYLKGILPYSEENCNLMNGLYYILSKHANVDVNGLSDYCAVSKRSLERNFRIHTGLSPKEMIDVIRYQLLWQECRKPKQDILYCVEKFGYYDCPHLYNSFKKFHGTSLPQAVKNL